jgi:hypothetical protein
MVCMKWNNSVFNNSADNWRAKNPNQFHWKSVRHWILAFSTSVIRDFASPFALMFIYNTIHIYTVDGDTVMQTNTNISLYFVKDATAM